VPDGEEKLLIAAAAPALIADVLRRFGSVRLRVSGNSMLPAIRPGDTLSVHVCALADVVPGDIVLFTGRHRLFVHRVTRTHVRCSRPYIVTKGDALAADDPPVRTSDLLGRVTEVRRDPATLAARIRRSGAGRVCGMARRACRSALRRLGFDFAGRRRAAVPSQGVRL
jgi:signal peptidase I